MDPSRPGHLRSDRAGLHGRGNDPLLLRSRPTSASLHRPDHFNLRLRHRSSPRITPMTCHNDSAPQGGPYRVLTKIGRLDRPVTLPPGRARLATNPVPTGSEAPTNTIGLVGAACFAAGTPSPGE